MGHISVLFVRKVVAAASAARRRSRYEAMGVDPEAPVDPKQMIEDTDFFDLLERVAAEDEDGRSVAIRVGATMRCDDYGAFGLAFKSAVDLAGSFRRVERYGRVVTSTANYAVIQGEASSFMEILPSGPVGLGVDMTNELAAAAATSLCREVSPGDFSPAAVSFVHRAPADPCEAKAFFACPVHYGASRDGLEIDDSLLRAGNRLGDERISEFFDSHLEGELADVNSESALVRRVRDEVARAMSEGVPAMAEVAGRMGMGARTLQRRLAEEEESFLDVVESVRRETAERLLARTDYSVAEVAFLTGFAEQSTFTRAFKRWTGQTPRAYRGAQHR